MKCALILTTGDRIDYLNQSIETSLNFIKEYNPNIKVDVFLISFNDVQISNINHEVNKLSYDRPILNSEQVINFPRSIQQISNYSNDIELIKRISFGHLILFGLIPDTIYKNIDIFEKYDLILKTRSDLVFDFNKSDIKNINITNQLVTFECFWGGCRYNHNFTNDHFIFGKSDEVLKVISYPFKECMLNHFWNPEQYMTYLYTKSKNTKIQLNTDKYYLLSNDRKSRKCIGFPLEKINKNDIDFLNRLGINKNIEFENEIYEKYNSL